MRVPNPAEEVTIDVDELEYEDGENAAVEEYDEKFLDIFKVTLCSEIALENIKERWADGEYELTPSPLYVNALRETYETGTEFLEKYDEPETRGDLSKVPREDLVELRGTVVEMAPHFGVDLEIADVVDDAE